MAVEGFVSAHEQTLQAVAQAVKGLDLPMIGQNVQVMTESQVAAIRASFPCILVTVEDVEEEEVGQDFEGNLLTGFPVNVVIADRSDSFDQNPRHKYLHLRNRILNYFQTINRLNTIDGCYNMDAKKLTKVVSFSGKAYENFVSGVTVIAYVVEQSQDV